MLLVRPGTIPSTVVAELKRLKPENITVLGGSNAVSKTVEEALDPFTKGKVTRQSGADRYGTAAAVAEKTFPHGVKTAYLASGEDFPDALAGVPAAALQNGPLLLTRPGALPTSTSNALSELGVENVIVLGGDNAVSERVEHIVGLTHHVTRLEGPDRYGTSVAISKASFAGTGTVFLATGEQFADALSGGAAAGSISAPLLLTRPTTLPPAVLDELKRLHTGRIVILGGNAAIDDDVKRAIDAALNPPSQIHKAVLVTDRHVRRPTRSLRGCLESQVR